MRRHGRITAAALGVATACLGLAGTGAAGVAGPAASAARAATTGYLGTERSTPALDRIATSSAPPSIAACERAGAPVVVECLDPARVRGAYGVTPLIDAGHGGAGQTIVIVDSYGSPTIAHDLSVFDTGYHIAPPPSFKVLAPYGTAPFHASNGTEAGWAGETTLDVEWSHAMAPHASIVLLTSPVAETEGTAGLGLFLKLEQYALAHKLGDVISQSWAATENTLETSAGRALVSSFNAFYQKAAAAHVTVFASAGDGGTQNPSDASGSTSYTFPTVGFPASSPWVTGIGGTALTADSANRWVSEKVWNDGPGGGAGGGGISQLFAEPTWQKHLPAAVQKQLHGKRGVPDVSWNAAESTSILVYSSFGGSGQTGWSFIAGTSEGSPQWAGLIADVDSARRQPIGFLDPVLYGLPEADFHDITSGDNAYGGVAGYKAVPGWDPASGLGTPRAGSLAQALIAAS